MPSFNPGDSIPFEFRQEFVSAWAEYANSYGEEGVDEGDDEPLDALVRPGDRRRREKAAMRRRRLREGRTPLSD